MQSAFLSYARTDDEPFVERLRDDLIVRGIEVWWDRTSMESRGRTFHQEILDAISTCDRLVLVVGPNAVASRYVRQEWEQALTCDKVVTPILRRGDFQILPDEFRLLHCEDFRDDRRYDLALANLTRQLNSPPPSLGKLIAVPSLPPHFLRREDRLRTLRDSLRADLDGPVVIGAVASRVGVAGMGGIGKSVLATALARDRKVREAFPDGIYWVPLGSEPNLVERMRETHRSAGGDGAFATVPEGKAALQEALREKRALLILDDVWNRPDADAFDVLGPRCRMLVTTRDSGLLTSLGGVHHVLDLMTAEESLDLLATASATERAELPDSAVAVVDECGRLPLAVALCGGLVRRGRSWQEVLTQLQQARLDRISDRHAVQEQHRSVWHAIHVSVAALDEADRERFIELAVFPPDETVPVEAVATLWSYENRIDLWEAEELIATLAERSLLQRTDASGRSANGGRRVSLHDIVLDYLRAEVLDRGALHDRLLACYRRRCSGGWPRGPDDGYFFNHLRHHLRGADRADELAELALDLEWLESKVSRGYAFDAPEDLRAAAAGLAAADPRRGVLELLEQALRRDLTFIAKHADDFPQALFQCLWNTCWWHDSPRASSHYDPPQSLPYEPAPWEEEGPKLFEVLERWRGERERRHPDFLWLRGLRPPPVALTSALLVTLHGLPSNPLCVAYSPDGARVAAGAADGTLCEWDVLTGASTMTVKANDEGVAALAYHPDGRRVLAGGRDGIVRIWDRQTAAVAEELTAMRGSIDGLCVDPRGRYAAAWRAAEAQVWDLRSGAAVASIAFEDRLDDRGRSTNGVVDGHFVDGDRFTAVTALGRRRTWTPEGGIVDETSRPLSAHARGFATLPHGTGIVSISERGDIDAGGRALQKVASERAWAACVAFSRDGRAFAAAFGRRVVVWDVASGRVVSAIDVGLWLTDLAFSPDGDQLLTCGDFDDTLRPDPDEIVWQVQIWDLRPRRHSRTLAEDDFQTHWPTIPITRSGPALAATTAGKLRVWDLESGTCRWSVDRSHGAAEAFSADGKFLIVSDDSNRAVYDAATGTYLGAVPIDPDAAPEPRSVDPIRVIRVGHESLLVRSDDPQPLAWFNGDLQRIGFHAPSRTLVAGKRGHLYLLRVEGRLAPSE